MFSLNNSNLSLLNITSGTEFVNFKRNIDLFFIIHSFLKGNKKSLTLKELMDNSGYKTHILEERLVWLIHQNLISVTKTEKDIHSENILLSISDLGFKFIDKFN